jgi:hypothetical protein
MWKVAEATTARGVMSFSNKDGVSNPELTEGGIDG